MAVFPRRSGSDTIALACGYGVICGLTFPLMVQGVFLHEIGLAHGAGESFGLFFFIAYSMTMLLSAACYGLAGGPGTGRTSLRVGLVGAFLGNALMLVHLLGIIPDGWSYSVAAACLLGCGLALGELGWTRLCSILCECRPIRLTRIISGSYLVGAAISAGIFTLSGAKELLFALTMVAVSTAAARFLPITLPTIITTSGMSISADLARPTVYLCVFSFVFGAVGQAGAVGSETPVQALALLGMGIAAVITLMASATARRVIPFTDVDAAVFPFAAIALVALPLVTASAERDLSIVLLFSAFFLISLNTRVTVCQLAWSAPNKAGAVVGFSLGTGGLAMLAGTAVGAAMLSGDNFISGIYTVSLVSLFTLSMATFLYREVSERKSIAPISDSYLARDNQQGTHALLASQLHLTARETEILELLCQGRSRAYIADELGLSPNTVKGYVHSLYQKAGVGDKQSLIDLVRNEDKRSSISR